MDGLDPRQGNAACGFALQLPVAARVSAAMDSDRPAHPTTKAYLLIIGIVIAIVVLAAISTYGH
jgi:hypothetical protein